MKKISLIFAALAIAACTAGCSQKNNAESTAVEPYPADMLITRLQAFADSGLTAFGHHYDTA